MFNEESIKYSLNNLKKHKARSFLTIFSILVGIATIFIFVSFGLGLYTYIDEISSSSSADKVLIMPKSAAGVMDLSGTVVLNDDDISAINRAPGVYEATGMYYGASQVKKDDTIKYLFLISYDPKKDFILDSFNIGAEEGRTLKAGDMKKVVLGYNHLLPDKIFEKPSKINDRIFIRIHCFILFICNINL
jgi:ABC-type antimicrobial peptide transport system permease subunit